MFTGVHVNNQSLVVEAIKHKNMDKDIDFSDSMSPAQVQESINNQEVEGATTPENPEPIKDTKPEDSHKEDDDSSTKSEEESAKTEDKNDAEDTEDKSDETLIAKKRTIYEEYKEKKNHLKAEKAENERLKSEIQEKEQTILNLQDKLKNTDNKEDKKDIQSEIEDEINSIAQEIGADPEGIKKLTSFLEKKFTKNTETPLSKEDLQIILDFKRERQQKQAVEQFNQEWSQFTPSLKSQFKDISDTELSNIQKEIERLAHTERYHDKEIDYIYYKEKDKLTKFISPKRKSFEDISYNRSSDNDDTEVEFSSKSSPIDIMRASEKELYGSKNSVEIRHT